MKLLVCTQKVDFNDPNLGFFHEWLLRLAEKVEKLTVICLEKGKYTLPQNITVVSLGKEKTKLPRLLRWPFYYWRFRKYIREFQYDGVFVHMNPEYVMLGWHFWKKMNKKILLWYTHKSVNWWLHKAEKRVDKIFTASKESFRLPSKKVEVVGHGIPVEIFTNQLENIPAEQLCLLAVGRDSPVKDFGTVIKAVQELKNNKNLPPIKFIIESERKYNEMPGIYHRYQILIHTSRTGSMDKVVLEAMASGRIVITSSKAYADLAKNGLVYAFPAGDYQELAKTIEKIYHSGILKKLPIQRGIDYVQQNHNLDILVGKIVVYFNV